MVKIDCLRAKDPPPLYSHMHPLKHSFSFAHHSFCPSLISLPLISAFPHFTLSPSFCLSLSLLHPSLTAFCSNTGVTSCIKSHGCWLEESDLKLSQDGSQTAKVFFFLLITVTQQGNCLSFISLHCKPVPLVLFLLSSSLLFPASPPLSTLVRLADPVC